MRVRAVASPWLRDLYADELLQLSGRMHLADNVATSDELPIDVELWDRRPFGERLDSIADLGGTKYIDRSVAWGAFKQTALKFHRMRQSAILFRRSILSTPGALDRRI